MTKIPGAYPTPEQSNLAGECPPADIPMVYKSDVLTCNVDDHDCPVCSFLNGSRTETVMLEVIRVLDKRLAEVEEYGDSLTKLSRDMIRQNADLLDR